MTGRSNGDIWGEVGGFEQGQGGPVPIGRIGLTLDHLARLSSRGILFNTCEAVDAQTISVCYQLLPDTPAKKLLDRVIADTTLSDEDKLDVYTRFIDDATYDEDDEHFRAQWLELF